MLEDLINQQWQALTRLVRGSKLLGQSKIKTLIERKKQRQKPSLVDTIGRHRKADALGEYRRRFASTAGNAAPVPPPMPIAPQAFDEPSPAPFEPFTPPPPPAIVRAPFPAIVKAPSAAFVNAPPFESLKARAPVPVEAPPPEPLKAQQAEPAKPQPPAEPKRLPERVQQAERKRRRLKMANQNGNPRPRSGWASRLSHRLGEALNNLPPSLAHDLRVLRQRKNELIAATAACIAVFGGAYVYHGPQADRSKPAEVTHAAPPPARAPEKIIVEERPRKPAGPNKKAYYDRLLPQTAETASETPAAPATVAAVAEAPAESGPTAQEKAAQPAQAKPQDEQLASASAPQVAAAAPVAASVAVSASAPIEAPATSAATAPAAAPVAVAETTPVADRPTWVKAEKYLPDGTRTDVPRPAAGPLPGEGEARKPVLAAVGPTAIVPEQAPEKLESASATPAQAPPPATASAPAEPPQASVTGYFAQVKSDQNQKAAEAELAAVADKYKSVLGQTPLITRSADLKDRGIWFRVLIGPVKSHDDADNICKRLKGAGLQDCIVQKLD